MDVSEARRLKALEDENTWLKRLLAYAALDNAALKDLVERNGDARDHAESRRSPLKDAVSGARILPTCDI